MILGMWVSWLMMLLLLLAAVIADTASPNLRHGHSCQEMCGTVDVPYPFGLHEHCALNKKFVLNCSSNSGLPDQRLLFGNITVRNISVANGTLTLSIRAAYDCYDKSGNRKRSLNRHWTTLGSGPFMFSGTRNKFTVVGCDTGAGVYDWKKTYSAACSSSCTQYVNMAEKSKCSGTGCCQTSIPEGLKSLNISVWSSSNYDNVSYFNLCGYAFLVDELTFKPSDWQLSLAPENKSADVVVDWAIPNETCQLAKANTSAYICGTYTNCIDTDNVKGYRCLCNQGFEGNPYLPDGCQDINECNDPQKYKCKGRCENIIGDYKCHCPFGMRGDGKTGGCQLSSITTIIAAIGAAIFFVIIVLLLYIILRNRRKDRNFRENGGMVLKHQRVRIFTEAELTKATNNYADDRRLGEGGFGCVYRGVLSDHTHVAVKKSKGALDKAQMNEDFQHEICTVSQVNHKNVVKLVGLCLETNVPLLVYEFVSNGTLFKHIHDKRSQVLTSWRNRLRIALESALALEYLHSLADPPVIHGDIKSVNILLDNNYTAKIADFGASVFNSPGQANIVTKIQGTFGYLDPEYLMTGNLTEKSDVYSFGVVLVELLTGKVPNSNSKSGEKRNIIQYFTSALDNNNLFQILDFQAADEGEMDEIEVVADVARRCINSIGINRPTMKEVSNELAKLKDLHENSWAQQNSEETEHLLGRSSDSFSKNVSAPMSHSQTVISFEIENYTDSI